MGASESLIVDVEFIAGRLLAACRDGTLNEVLKEGTVSLLLLPYMAVSLTFQSSWNV